MKRVSACILIVPMAAALFACDRSDAPSSTVAPAAAEPATTSVKPSAKEHALLLIRQAYVARDINPDGLPQDTRIFDGAGPVALYVIYSGAASDTILVELFRGGRSVKACDSSILNGDNGYFCRFDEVGGGDYEIVVHINAFVVGSLPFTVRESDVAAVANTEPISSDEIDGPTPSAPNQFQAVTTSIGVGYGDLNLSAPDGVRTLLHRMDSAANVACGPPPQPKQLGALQRFKICKQDAMSRAVKAINSPLLTAMFTGQPGQGSAQR